MSVKNCVTSNFAIKSLGRAALFGRTWTRRSGRPPPTRWWPISLLTRSSERCPLSPPGCRRNRRLANIDQCDYNPRHGVLKDSLTENLLAGEAAYMPHVGFTDVHTQPSLNYVFHIAVGNL